METEKLKNKIYLFKRVLVSNALLFVLFTAFLTPGCSHFLLRPEFTNNSGLINPSNKKMKSFKGIGSLKLKRGKNRIEKYRFAWASILPDKLFCVVLVAGQKVETIAADGDNIYIRSETGAHRFIKSNADNPDLERILGVSVKVRDIIKILSGQGLVAKYSGYETVLDNDTGIKIITLKTFWGREVEKIHFNSDGQPCIFEIKKAKGYKLFEVKYDSFKQFAGYSIPERIKIISGGGANECSIRIDSFFPDVDIEKNVFTLKY